MHTSDVVNNKQY